MPVCVLLGTLLLFAFVNFSHSYLSEYFVRNSKDLIGQKVDLTKLSDRLGDSRTLGFATAHNGLNIQLAFWSLSCSPCLEKLAKYEAGPTPANLIIPINVDPEKDIEEAKATLNKLAPSMTFYHDFDRSMMTTFKVDYLPTYVIIDNKGFIKEILSGPTVE